MALNPTKTVTNPRIAKLIELEVSGRIKPEHQQELDSYRAMGRAPARAEGVVSKDEQANIRAEAIDKIKLARSLQQRSRDGYFATGFGANVAGMVTGSPAYDVKQDTETLRNAGALTRIMEMSKSNGDKNPLAPLSNSDFQALASSLSNIDVNQSDEQFQRNVQRVIDLYERAYAGAGGTSLEADLAAARDDKAAPAANAAPNDGAGGDSGNGPIGPQAKTLSIENLTDFAAGLSGGRYDVTEDGGLTYNGQPVDAGVDILNSDQYREAYQKKFGKPAPLNVDVMGGEASPDNRSTLEQQRDTVLGEVDATVRGLADTASLGIADPLAAAARSAFNDDGFAANLARERAISAADKQVNPVARFAGQAGGLLMGEGLLSMGAAKVPAIGRLADRIPDGLRPFVKDAVLAGTYGGISANSAQEAPGAVLGNAIAGAGGGFLGRNVARGAGALLGPGTRRLVNAGAEKAGLNFRLATPPAIAAGENAVISKTTDLASGDIINQLDEARKLGIPMTLADTAPALGSLAGAAVRRSTNAAKIAEDVLIPRSRAQIDRFGQAVNRDLGPTGNIPQLSEDLAQTARTNAAPLYEEAYARSVPSTPELDAILSTPFGRQALSRARTIAANERRSPDELGFALDAEGGVVLNPLPSREMADHLAARAALDEAQAAYRAARTQKSPSLEDARGAVERARVRVRQSEQALAAAPDPSQAASVPAYTQQTLDYVKRGMDDILEEQRNPVTGKLVLDEAGRAMNNVRQALIRENDKLNAAYAPARQAYQGPISERDALRRGQDAFGLTPDELRMQVGTQTPGQLEQMRLGYRSQLLENGRNARTASNPFDLASTVGTPASVDRLGILYPDSGQLLRQADLERGLARTTNDILGNSKTAQRLIADADFAGNPLLEGALHAGAAVASGGASVPGSAARLVGAGVRDRLALGFGQRAVAKADEIAPILLDPNPVNNLAVLKGLIDKDAARRAYLNDRTGARNTLGALLRSGAIALVPSQQGN